MSDSIKLFFVVVVVVLCFVVFCCDGVFFLVFGWVLFVLLIGLFVFQIDGYPCNCNHPCLKKEKKILIVELNETQTAKF